MAELLGRYGPPSLAWVVLLALRPRPDHGRRQVRWVLLGLAVSLTALTPAAQAVFTALGAPDLHRLVGHAGMLLAVGAARQFLVRLTGSGRWPHRHTVWIAGVFALMCVLFALTPNLLPQSPWVMEYCLAYAAAQLPALLVLIGLCVRFARSTRDVVLRSALGLIALGVAGAVVYLVSKTALAVAARFPFDFPWGHSFFLGKVVPGAAHVLVLAGAGLPALASWVAHYRQYVRLRPLWTALYRADPAIALEPPVVPDFLVLTRLRLQVYRRVIEIRDGLLALQPYRDARVSEEARRTASAAGLSGECLEATVEATAVAAALRAREAGIVPQANGKPVAGGHDLASDTEFLDRVARVYRALPKTRTPVR